MTPADYKSAREKLGLTQEQLAELVGVSVRTIASRESGQHAVSREAAIAIRALESDTDLAMFIKSLSPENAALMRGGYGVTNDPRASRACS